MPSSRLILTAALAVLAVLAAPGAAGAATVSPGQSIQKAIDAAAAGETITIRSGTYSEVVSTAKAVVLAAEPATLLINPSSVTEGPTLKFTGAADEKVTGLIVVSTVGDAVQVGTGKTLLQRDLLVSLAKAGAALSAQSDSQAPAASAITVDSTALAGATAISAKYASPGTLGGKGIAIAARHVTAIGNVVADASSAAPGSSPLSITFSDSIVRGTRTAVPGQGSATPLPVPPLPASPLPALPGVPVPLPAPSGDPLAATAATISADTKRNDVKDAATDAAALFVRPAAFNFHLRADAPVIDKGQSTTGESATDIDGDPRTIGPASDYGADEFANKPPTAALGASSGRVRQNATVTFSAARSADPEATTGGGITSYRWSFGDGTSATTATPTTTHAYAAKGTYAVTVSVTDRQGAASAASSPVGVEVIDGVPPAVTVSQPTANQRITLYKKARKGKRARRAKVTFFGSAQDDTALSAVFLALRSAKSTNGSCRWFDGKTKLVSASCAAPVLLTPQLANGAWRYTLPGKARLKRGAYQLVAVSLDASGLPSPIQTVALRFR